MTWQVTYGFIVRNFNADIRNTDANKCYKYKAKSLGKTAAQLASNAANVILIDKESAIKVTMDCRTTEVHKIK